MHRKHFFVCTSVLPVFLRVYVNFNESQRKHSDTRFNSKQAESKVNRKYANTVCQQLSTIAAEKRISVCVCVCVVSTENPSFLLHYIIQSDGVYYPFTSAEV